MNKTLSQLLESAFGFSSFRPNQEAVCQAAISGRDVLLVMPTGSGKSLCYQLPAIARGGTTLVISPLIALMDDQVAKLKELGFAVDAIHSGKERSASRQACINYLTGKQQFLFIAPERLRVAGFPEMLAKRKPSLIAIDEAHCISQWGHDFRPDYRRLGEYLPLLRPAPVIALTATATPVVQDDISKQLGLVQPSRFIHGFRRTNIAIEVVQVSSSERLETARELLLPAERRPAIVYTPSRKQAEALAAHLATEFSVGAYHAGLDAEHRKRVQERFLAGKIEVMTATIAFGMGIDKADVRTVIHTALPGSLEAYYQEIGRAGRDSHPSRAILMHSYADRHTHDFFFSRDYPEVAILDTIFAALGPESQEKSLLQRRLGVDPDVFDKALEKLWIHGGAILTFSENVSRGQARWRDSYLAHGKQKQKQIEQVIRYAEANDCRMSTLVRHFGDLADAEDGCDVCDFCAPAQCAAQRFRTATEAERTALFRVVTALRSGDTKATGRLYSDLYPENGRTAAMSRSEFEEVLGAMARAGLLSIADATFEKDGKPIPYRRVRLLPAAHAVNQNTPIEFVMKNTGPVTDKRKAKGSPSKSSAKKQTQVAGTSAQPKEKLPAGLPDGPPSAVEEALRAWRLSEARKTGVPAFLILSDRVLRAIAHRRPDTDGELLSISGIGTRTLEKYGTQIRHILHAAKG